MTTIELALDWIGYAYDARYYMAAVASAVIGVVCVAAALGLFSLFGDKS